MASPSSSFRPFDLLPDELLEQILSYLVEPSDFRHLCIQSMRCRNIAQGFLFIRCELTRFRQPTRPFLRTVLDRPDLAAKVEELTMYPSCGNYPYGSVLTSGASFRPTPAMQPRLLVSAITAAQRLPSPTGAEMIRDLRRNEGVAEIALIVISLPNLKRLSIPLTGSMTAAFDTRAMIHLDRLSRPNSMGIYPCFGQLSEIILENGAPYHRLGISGTYRLHTIRSVLLLPSLRHLTVHGFHDRFASDWNGWREDQASCSITHLDLRRCWLGADTVARIVRACRALGSVQLQFFTPDFAPVGNADWFDDVGDALQCQAGSLKTIRIECLEEECRVARDGPHVTRPLGSLRRFGELRLLDVPQMALLGERGQAGEFDMLVDVLPLDLEVLILTGCDESI